jgi:uncharacterized repeat protein (TIGR01451 family)
MLAIKSIFTRSFQILGVALAIAPMIASSAMGQQTPSQRYQPVTENVYDSAQAAQDYYPERVHRGGVVPASFQTSEPAVPAILAGASTQPQTKTATGTNSFALPPTTNQQSIGGSTRTMPRQSPADLAAQMSQHAVGQPNQDLLPPPPAAKTRTSSIPVGVIPQVGGSDFRPQTRPTATPQQTATNKATTRVPVQQPMVRTADNRASLSRTTTNDLRSTSYQQPTSQPQTTSNRPSTTRHASHMPAARTPVQNSAFQQTMRSPAAAIQDTQVRPAAATQPTPEKASIKIAAPSIEVLTVGPQTIGINKPSIYRVIVRNNSTIKADRVLVGINLPAWVDIENLTMTSGGKEITDGKQQARLVWSVDQIAGNSNQTMTITAVPRKAEIFDVGVEWTLVPMVGKTTIRVTEPKLEMSISGPKEVQYGETALYHVAVRNPGTGAADNVTVMLPEALGGERANLGVIPPGKEKNFQVELLARTAGDLNLLATATGDGSLKASAERALIVRRANLEITMRGPPLKYAGGIGKYSVTVNNSGDSTATDLLAAIALPAGVKYLKGIDAVKLIDGGMRWPVGSLAPGQSRTYDMFCELNSSGDLKLDAGVRGKAGSDLAASGFCTTTVETIADLVLTVADLKGPLPTGEKVPYTIKIRNRGTKAARGVDVVMQFSEGIEPHSAKGLEHRIAPGKVTFSPISKIDPGQEVSFEVTAEAYKSGTHIFRAQLTCKDSDSREIAEGTTRYFGDAVAPPEMLNRPMANTADADNNSFK